MSYVSLIPPLRNVMQGPMRSLVARPAAKLLHLSMQHLALRSKMLSANAQLQKGLS